MGHKVLTGLQWGDEGKGKITDLLAEKADVVVRFAGGNNAGHTVIVEEEKFELHLIPAGILYPEKYCLLGNGMVIDPFSLIEEMEGLEERGLKLDRLFISSQAHLVLPYHQLIDNLEENRKEGDKIGTTGRGIGPAYADKASRRGLRVGDLLKPLDFSRKLEKALNYHNQIIEKIYSAKPLEHSEVKDKVLALADKIKPHITNIPYLLADLDQQGKAIFFEGAQGTMLDLDHGTYPYVTSSNPAAGGVSSGTGMGPASLEDIIGVAKAYLTRVGKGPFPTELTDEVGHWLQERGNEFGVTTGRPRRCGWLDLPALRYAALINSTTEIALTKLDVLSGLEEIKVCTAYDIAGEKTAKFPDSWQLKEAQPIYKTLPGWEEDITGITSFKELPPAAQDYVNFIEEEIALEISLLSTGPERNQVIKR